MCSLLYSLSSIQCWVHLLFWAFVFPTHFHHPFCNGQSKSSATLTGSLNTNASWHHITVCPGYSPFCFQSAKAGTWGVLYCGSSGVLVLCRGGPKVFLTAVKADHGPQIHSLNTEWFHPCPNMCSFAVAGHQRNLMVNHKLLSTPPSDFLGIIIGSSPPILPPPMPPHPWRRCKLSNATGMQRGGQRACELPTLGGVQEQAAQGSVLQSNLV